MGLGSDGLQAHYRALFETSLDPMGVGGADGRFILMNEAWTRVLGFARTELEGRLFIELVHKEDLKTTQAALDKLRRGGDLIDFENRYRAADGGYRTIRWRATPSLDGTCVFNARDVTEEAEQTKELARMNAFYRHVVAMSGVGGWEVDLATGKPFWDAQTRAIHEVPPDYEPSLEDAIEFYAPEYRNTVQQMVQDGIEKREGWFFELPLITAKGRRIWVQATGDPIVEHGEVVRLVGAFRDITEQKARAQTLDEARIAAEAATMAKSQFLANMSHEIRTPMTGVLGMLDTVLEGALQKEQRRSLSIARDSAWDLLSILNDILDYSKLEANGVELEKLPVSPKLVVEAAFGLLGGKAKDNRVHLITEISESVPAWVSLDPTRIRQVLLNLLGNAIKFTSEGQVKVAVDFLQGNLIFEVVDSGIGMTQEAIGRLFSRFEQADGSTTRKFGGTGLGLAISNQLVELMGGAIEVQSSPGVGSTFRVRIPVQLCEPPAQPRSYAEGVRQEELPRLKILAADDNAVNRMVLERMLKKRGHEIHLVMDGLEVVQAVQEHSFDLVLMDIQMPNMDGVQATKAIRALEGPVSKIPIVALTAHALKDEEERYRDAGMDGYATKPIVWPKLCEAIAESLEPKD